jgi:hypothetical protein
LSPAASAYTAAEWGLRASTAAGGISFVLERSGVAVATLTHGAHTAEKVMLGAEFGLYLFVQEPETELKWVSWGDTTGCAP